MAAHRLRALAFLGRLALEGGTGAAILAEPSASRSRQRLRAVLASRMPGLKWFEMEEDAAESNRVLSTLRGKPVRADYRLDRARVILSLDGDLLGSSPGEKRSK